MTKPTRDEHLLDLALTDIPGTTTKVSAGIADHKIVTDELKFKIPEQVTLTRMFWQFAKADWDMMRDMVSTVPWEDMRAMHASDASEFLNKSIFIKRATLHTATRTARTQIHASVARRSNGAAGQTED